MLSLGLLILRLMLGLTMAAHGSQKVFGWFKGQGIHGFRSILEKQRLKPAYFWAWAGGLVEFVGGLMVALGLLSPIGSFAIMASMAMAIILVHRPQGFWNTNRGMEFPLLIAAAALALTFTGPGAISLDGWFGIALPEPGAWIVGAIVLVLGVGAALLSRATDLPAANRQARLS